ncbi:hypothetical protein H0H93_013297 [Arthromyces matolae]|nr:hypothetical protein H0H93_013297 [Arthromyces matolae]
MPPLSVQDLLNPAEELRDILPTLRRIHELLETSDKSSIMAPLEVSNALDNVLDELKNHRDNILSLPSPTSSGSSQRSTSTRSPSPTTSSSQLPPVMKTDVRLNRQTTLSKLYIIDDENALVEYPESGIENPVGYLFRQHVKDSDWEDPWKNFCYSLGDPKGTHQKTASCWLLKDAQGEEIPCILHHWTCKPLT